MGVPEPPLEQRETENVSLKRELQALKPELQLIKSEVSREIWGFLVCCAKRE